ncbi:MAG: sugar nucleotide-binding protein, partial [Synergistaceae bacterium]|nr:sugar nucleotide-binding protein [Synergistaceae bacterium]
IIMTYISTDYIFDGSGSQALKPEDENFAPLNYYGQTKFEGELAVKKFLRDYFIVRIAWVFGPHGNNFVKTMLKLSENHDTLRVVNDQIGTPTYTPDLAKLLVDMNLSEKFGIYHATNEGGFISWYDFACEIFAQAGKNVNIIPVSTSEYGQSKAKRPSNSRLDKSKLKLSGFDLLPDWRDALRRYLQLE